MIVRFIGDVHGKFARYAKAIENCSTSVQVGDMGVGFPTEFVGVRSTPPLDRMLFGDHRFIRGNHDFPDDCKLHPRYIQDGTIENHIMYIGGAVSIDKDYRTPGVSWWADEELSYQQLDMLVEDYTRVAPEIMVTHECPESIAEEMCRRVGWRKFECPSRTRQAFEVMWSKHKPKMWLFGHWHISFDANIMGTRFICLNELEWADIDTETFEILNKGNLAFRS